MHKHPDASPLIGTAPLRWAGPALPLWWPCPYRWHRLRGVPREASVLAHTGREPYFGSPDAGIIYSREHPSATVSKV